MGKLDKYKIWPAVITDIEHRSECIPYYHAFWSTDADAWCLSGATLPIFTAPMACVVNDKNYFKFDNQGIIPIIPRTVSLENRLILMKQMIWITMGLDEFSEFIKSIESLPQETYICIDMANGHMKKLIDVCREAKDKFGNNLILMTGNIANPITYLKYAEAGIDFVRCSIGSGGACLTAKLTGVEYEDLGQLIKDTYFYKTIVETHPDDYKSIPKIVADGGLESIRDIIVALALGADYVMLGQMLTQCREAAGEIIPKLIDVTEEVTCFTYNEDNDLFKYLKDNTKKTLVDGRMYYGMSTERAQKEMGNKKIKPAEGNEKWVPIKYTIEEWVNQFVAAISSTMSYCNKTMLSDFIGYES